MLSQKLGSEQPMQGCPALTGQLTSLNSALPSISPSGASPSGSPAGWVSSVGSSVTGTWMTGFGGSVGAGGSVGSGASVGAAVAILLGLEAYMLGVGTCALVTGLLTIVVIYRIASIGNRMHTTTLLLTGVCITFLMSAIISFIMVLRQDKMDSIIFWTMGSFASASWTEVAIVAPVVAVGIGIVLYYARDLNLLLAGSETARSLGVEVERVKRVLLLSTTLMVAFCVATCGVIGFVGLVVPHCLRLVLGPDNRRIVPCAIFAGGLFMLLCDTLARTLLMPAELPVGSLTALAGAPLFIYLLYKNKKRY